MYTAAANFTHGDEENQVTVYARGDEVPAEIAEDAEFPKHLILEYLANEDPDSLSRSQLMALAKVGPFAASGNEGESDQIEEVAEFDQEAFQKALDDFPTKSELVAWAEEIYPNLEVAGSRADMEATIIAHASGEDEEE